MHIEEVAAAFRAAVRHVVRGIHMPLHPVGEHRRVIRRRMKGPRATRLEAHRQKIVRCPSRCLQGLGGIRRCGRLHGIDRQRGCSRTDDLRRIAVEMKFLLRHAAREPTLQIRRMHQRIECHASTLLPRQRRSCIRLRDHRSTMKAARHRFADFTTFRIEPAHAQSGLSGAQLSPNRCQRGRGLVCGENERLAFRGLDAETIALGLRDGFEVKRRRKLKLHRVLIPERHTPAHRCGAFLDGTKPQGGINRDDLTHRDG